MNKQPFISEESVEVFPWVFGAEKSPIARLRPNTIIWASDEKKFKHYYIIEPQKNKKALILKDAVTPIQKYTDEPPYSPPLLYSRIITTNQESWKPISTISRTYNPSFTTPLLPAYTYNNILFYHVMHYDNFIYFVYPPTTTIEDDI